MILSSAELTNFDDDVLGDRIMAHVRCVMTVLPAEMPLPASLFATITSDLGFYMELDRPVVDALAAVEQELVYPLTTLIHQHDLVPQNNGATLTIPAHVQQALVERVQQRVTAAQYRTLHMQLWRDLPSWFESYWLELLAAPDTHMAAASVRVLTALVDSALQRPALEDSTVIHLVRDLVVFSNMVDPAQYPPILAAVHAFLPWAQARFQEWDHWLQSAWLHEIVECLDDLPVEQRPSLLPLLEMAAAVLARDTELDTRDRRKARTGLHAAIRKHGGTIGVTRGKRSRHPERTNRP